MKKFIKNSLFVQGLIFLIFSLFIITKAINMRDFGESFLSPGIFPALFGGVLVILSLNLMYRGYKEIKKSGRNKNYDNIDKVSLINVILVFIFSLSYLWALSYLGFIISSIIYLFIFMYYIGERRIWFLIAISILTPLISYLIFSMGLGINLP